MNESTTSLDFPDELSAYNFELPEDLIAQEPPRTRDGGRLLVVRRHPAKGLPRFEDLKISDLPSFAAQELPQSLWIRNRSRVMPARFYARRSSGSQHEIVLLEETEKGIWKALIRKQARMKFPEKLFAHGEEFQALDREHVDLRNLSLPLSDFLIRFGEMPLPPYIKNREAARDNERYQPLWANKEKDLSVAAPTASLHFSEALIADLETKAGIRWADILLHVGLGTFEPVRVSKLSEHKIHRERLEISELERQKILHFSGPRVAVGTTALRTLESLPKNSMQSSQWSWEQEGEALKGWTEIFIKGQYDFRFADALFTNFHLPESTLFVLVSSFAGSLQMAKEAYDFAISKRFRFFSYGDASVWV